MRWKLFNAVSKGEMLPILHWPYRPDYEFLSQKRKTAFIPFAIILAYFFAFSQSFRDVQKTLLDVQEKHKGDK